MKARRYALLLGVTLACGAATAMATDYTFTGNTNNTWNNPNNWSPIGKPGGADKATIPSGKTCQVIVDDQEAEEVIVAGTLTVTGKTLTVGDEVLEVQNAGTVTITNTSAAIHAHHIDVQSGGTLGIVGGTLVLGKDDNATPTTSTVDGTLYFEKVGSVLGTLLVRDYVTIDGEGTMTASVGDDSDYAGMIQLYAVGANVYGDGLILDEDVKLKGTVQVYCRIELKRTSENQYARILVDHASDVFKLGSNAPTYERETMLKGDGQIQVSAGKLEVKAVTFNATTPPWILSGGEIEVQNWPDSDFTELFLKIVMTGGTLDIDSDLSTSANSSLNGGTIELANGKTAELLTPPP